MLVASGAMQSTLSTVDDGLEQPQIMKIPLDTGGHNLKKAPTKMTSCAPDTAQPALDQQIVHMECIHAPCQT